MPRTSAQYSVPLSFKTARAPPGLRCRSVTARLLQRAMAAYPREEKLETSVQPFVVCCRGQTNLQTTSRSGLTQVNLLGDPVVYFGEMMKTPAEIRAHAETYRELHAHLEGPILTQAIEDVALALDQLAESIERQDDAIRDASGPR